MSLPAASATAPATGSRRRLGAVARGECVRIDHLDGDLDATTVRLLEMGLVPGTIVQVTRRAPLGDPMEVRVRETRLCLRRADANRFVVVAP